MQRNLRAITKIALTETHRTRGWFCLLTLAALVLLAACGNNSTTTGSTTTTAPTATSNTSVSSTPTSTDRYGKGYGSGSNTTPTPTAPITGPTKTVMIITDSSGKFAFSPATLTIPVGTTVTWMNTTQAPHTVTSDDGKTFDSGIANPVSPGTSFSFKFTTAGTFAYHCQFHLYMKATIIVQ